MSLLSQLEKLAATFDPPPAAPTLQKARSMVKRLDDSFDDPAHSRLWCCCALFVAGLFESRNEPSVAALLTAADLQPEYFFQALNTFLETQGFGIQLYDLVQVTKRKYIVSSLLFQKYCVVLQRSLQQTKATSASEATDVVSFEEARRFGWLLFIVAQTRLLGQSPDLVMSFYFLICSMEVLVWNWKHVAGVSLGTPLDAICEEHGLDARRVHMLRDSTFVPLLSSLLNSGGDQSQSILRPPDGTSESPLVELLHPDVIQGNIERLAAEYGFVYMSSRTYDDRAFLERELGPINVNVSPSQSPHSPITKVMHSVGWLDHTVGGDVSDHKLDLAAILGKDHVDVEPLTKACATHCDRLRDALAADPNAPSEMRIRLIVRLYRRFVATMVLAEQHRQRKQTIVNMLSKDTFHNALAVIAVELVVYAYKQLPLAFPRALSVCSASAFDVCKVVESVIRREPSLPPALVTHLNEIEERMLEDLTWLQDSPIYTHLSCPETQAALLKLLEGSDEDSSSGSLLPATPGRTPVARRGSRQSRAVFGSPAPATAKGAGEAAEADAAQGASPLPTTPGASGAAVPGVSFSLRVFFQKLLRLMLTRLHPLARKLDLPTYAFDQVWRCCIRAVVQHGTTLLRNRHIDHILLCSMFAVCRVHDMHIKFNDIIRQYRDLPHFSRHTSRVYRQVPLKDAVVGTIIQFYNTFFIQAMNSFVARFKDVTEVSSPRTKAFGRTPLRTPVHLTSTPSRWQQGAASPMPVTPFTQKWSSRIAVSPLSATPRPYRALPSSHRYTYSPRSSPHNRLAAMNQIIRGAPRGGRRAPKRLFAGSNGSEPDAEAVEQEQEQTAVQEEAAKAQQPTTPKRAKK